MISWKYSLEKINGELELAKNKRHALEKLFKEEKVSQPTYDSFSKEIAEAITEIEAKQNGLIEKMQVKIDELEQQMKTLEYLLVNSEIRHVSGEIEEETYYREHNVLSLGLETTKEELKEIKEAISNLTGETLTGEPASKQETTQLGPDAVETPEIVMDTEEPQTEATTDEQPTTDEQTEIAIEDFTEKEQVAEPSSEEPQGAFDNTGFQSEEESPEASSESVAEIQQEFPAADE